MFGALAGGSRPAGRAWPWVWSAEGRGRSQHGAQGSPGHSQGGGCVQRGHLLRGHLPAPPPGLPSACPPLQGFQGQKSPCMLIDGPLVTEQSRRLARGSRPSIDAGMGSRGRDLAGLISLGSYTVDSSLGSKVAQALLLNMNKRSFQAGKTAFKSRKPPAVRAICSRRASRGARFIQGDRHGGHDLFKETVPEHTVLAAVQR